MSSNYKYESVENKEYSFSNKVNGVSNNLVFPNSNTIEKFPFNMMFYIQKI